MSKIVKKFGFKIFLRRLMDLTVGLTVGFSKVVGILSLLILLSVAGLSAFFFFTPSFAIEENQVRWAIEKFTPKNFEIFFAKADVRFDRPEALPFVKHLKIRAKDFCVRYEGKAVSSCVGDLEFGVAGGWGGERLSGESKWKPRLAWIDPIILSQASLSIDLPSIPQSPEKGGDQFEFDFLEFLRTELLPKWRITGSHIDLQEMVVKTAENEGVTAHFDLFTEDDGQSVSARLYDVRSIGGAEYAEANFRLVRPSDKIDGSGAWRLVLEGVANLGRGKGVFRGPTRTVRVQGDANIFTWDSLDFRLTSNWKGIAALREVRLEGELKEAMVNGKFSLKMGAASTEVRQLDFVNCGVDANLNKKTGGIHCGPQSVRLSVRERKLFRDPKLFIFTPQFDLDVTRLDFGARKRADLVFNLTLDHYGIAKLTSRIEAIVLAAESDDDVLRYQAKGNVELVTQKFSRVVSLFARTPFAVPAPIRTLDGSMGFQVNAEVNESGGLIEYQAATRLNSKYQRVAVDADGQTQFLIRENGAIQPSSDFTVRISKMALSVPRLDLRLPPRFRPDPRFGPIRQDEELAHQGSPKSSPPMNFKVRILTTQPEAIQLATNLTGGPIPISLDVIYDERSFDSPPVDLKPAARGLASLEAGGSAIVDVPLVKNEKRVGKTSTGTDKPVVTGWVTVGRTPIEVFKRKAVVEQLRVDLLPDGEQRLNGVVGVKYADYAISVLLRGPVTDPQLHLTSEPPLDDDQILSVLIFGRPLNELDEDQKSSVSSLNAAFADAVLGVSSLYFLSNTPIESVGYDSGRDLVMARVGIGGGASIEVGGGADSTGVGFRKRLSREFTFRSDVERIGTTGKQTVSAVIEWVQRF